MTRRHAGATPFVLVAVAGLLLSGCGEEYPDETIDRQLVSSSTTTPPTGEEVAKERARGAVYQYVSGRNTVLSDPGSYRDTSSIGFAEGRAATSVVAEAGELDVEHHRLSGQAKLTADPEATDIDLDPPAKGGAAVAPFVEVRGCIDESATYAVDASGAKVEGSQGPGPHPVRFHVINRQWPSPSGWQIAWFEELKGSC